MKTLFVKKSSEEFYRGTQQRREEESSDHDPREAQSLRGHKRPSGTP